MSGHFVDTAENGEDALQKMLHESYDAVVMDLQMPIMGGLEACRRLREYESKFEEDKEDSKSGRPNNRLAVIGVSASVDGDVRMEALEAGMDFLLARPHSIQKLLDTIASVLGSSSGKKTSSSSEILVVDDSTPVLKTTKRALEVAGFTVQVASNGRDALSLMREHFFDAVVMDVRMPGMSGTEVTKQYRAYEFEEFKGEDRHLYIVGVSNATDEDAEEEALASGMDAYVVKSGAFNDLVRALKTNPGQSEPRK